MKRILRHWINDTYAKRLSQVHLHIDDPTLVTSQKPSEQEGRDHLRNLSVNVPSRDVEHDGLNSVSDDPGFQKALVIPWNYPFRDGRYKDEPASLHIIYSAIAIDELVEGDSDREISIYLHGGSFAIMSHDQGKKATRITPRRRNLPDFQKAQSCITLEFDNGRNT